MTEADNTSHPGILNVQQHAKSWRVLDGAMSAIITPSWEWPTVVRRVYLCTLPLSLPLRICAVVALLVAMYLLFGYGWFEQWCRAIWNGRRPEH